MDSFERRCRSRKITYKQTTVLINYMVENTNFARGKFSGRLGKVNYQKQWAVLKELLDGHGPSKTVDQWKKAWKDLKSKVRSRNAKCAYERRTPGNIPASTPPLTIEEQKVMSIIRKESSKAAKKSWEIDGTSEECEDLPIQVSVEEEDSKVGILPAAPQHVRSSTGTTSPTAITPPPRRNGLYGEIDDIKGRVIEYEERRLKILENISHSLDSLAQREAEKISQGYGILSILERIANKLEQK
ncbi:uncharacterized protein [Hetaerina americana]|uniref:uncharacterized protein n=1 Tax=Hetaerina americana TaxID=62018 RepID=UPI003A7F2EDC